MAIENLHTLKGTLYAKDCRKVPNKKRPTEPDWEFFSIKVECKVLISGRTIVQIPELSLDKGLSYESFEIGDAIEVDYYLIGKQITQTFYKTECKAVFIKFSDMQTNSRPNRQLSSDTDFVPPTVRDTEKSNDDFDNLPF
jgi:hypothetical protein